MADSTNSRVGVGDAEGEQRTCQFLARPTSYPDHPSDVERIDTHISTVFLTDRHAYKLKKRVAFEFLDFRSPAARLAACREEVRVNRRLAPDVYLGVEALTCDPAGRMRWAGPRDAACDWVVKMKRLPESARLDRLIAERRLSDGEFQELIDLLLTFYQGLPPLPVSVATYMEQLTRHVEGNATDLGAAGYPVSTNAVTRVHDAQRRLLRLWPDRWASRVCDGRIVDGHGDLRPEHVYLSPRPAVIDAIEFNAEYRRLDVLDELCFFAVELEMTGAGEWGRRVLRRYFELSGDRPPPGIEEFYRSYRACVRGKVVWLRSRQLQGTFRRDAEETAGRYVAAAENSLGRLARPWLVVVRGLSGSGKSTLAAALADPLVAETLRTDELRRETADEASANGASASGAATEFGAARYSPERRQEVYATLLRRAAERLNAGRSAILDGTFLDARHRAAAAALADTHSAHFLEATCRCSDAAARRRIAERLARGGDPSEFHPDWLAQQAEEETPCTPTWRTCELNADRPPEELVEDLLARVRRMLDDAAPRVSTS